MASLDHNSRPFTKPTASERLICSAAKAASWKRAGRRHDAPQDSEEAAKVRDVIAPLEPIRKKQRTKEDLLFTRQ